MVREEEKRPGKLDRKRRDDLRVVEGDKAKRGKSDRDVSFLSLRE